MALITCRNCGKQVSDTTERCIHCNCPTEEILEKTTNKRKGKLDILGLVLICVTGLGLLYHFWDTLKYFIDYPDYMGENIILLITALAPTILCLSLGATLIYSWKRFKGYRLLALILLCVGGGLIVVEDLWYVLKNVDFEYIFFTNQWFIDLLLGTSVYLAYKLSK